jgi:TatD DNase family protein
MLPEKEQYVNIHAHRCPVDKGEWVLRSLKSWEYPPDLDPCAAYSVGLHPWEIADRDVPNALKKVRLATENSQVLAIGEVGLDSFTEATPELQMKVFEEQVELAVEARLPVIIHAVKTYQELIGFSKSERPTVPMIIHGFRGSIQLAEDLLRHGYYLSFGEPLLESDKVREVFSRLPIEKLFLETDESEAPIGEIYFAAAELKCTTLSSVRLHMFEKTMNMFSRK